MSPPTPIRSSFRPGSPETALLRSLARTFPFVTSYGYHFDAHLVGAFLRDVGKSRGIRHVDARIALVDLAENGDVRALVSDDGRRFEAELFVDASGFRAAIIEGALDEPHRSFAENLFNDRAVVTPDSRSRSAALRRAHVRPQRLQDGSGKFH